MGIDTPKDYDSMDFAQLEADSIAGPILQEVSLYWLKTYDKEYFDREFTGELDSEGYLKSKSGGSSNTKPSQTIQGNADTIAYMTKDKLMGR